MRYPKEPDFKLAEYVERRFVLDVDPETTLDEIEKPEFWRGLSKKMPPKSHITVFAKDGSFEAAYRVIKSDTNFAFVRRIYAYFYGNDGKPEVINQEKPNKTAKEKPEYDIKWAGPASKFRVFRTDDNSVIKDGFDTQREAKEFISKYVSASTDG